MRDGAELPAEELCAVSVIATLSDVAMSGTARRAPVTVASRSR